MSTRAIEPSDAETPTVLRVLSYLDLVVLVLAAPIFLLAGFSMLGYGVAGGVWIVQRGVRDLVQSRAEAATDVRTAVGLTAASMIIRGWVVAFAIFAVGLRDSEAGLAAAVLFLFLFSIFFTMQAIVRPRGASSTAHGPESSTTPRSTR